MAVNIISHDVKGFNVRQREVDGYLDLTGMAAAHGKKISGYLRLKGTEEFLEELEAVMQINATQLVQVIQGGIGEQGTWGHPLVAINCGQWCSAKFAVGVSLLVFDWM